VIDLMRSQEPDLDRIIPVFIERFNAAYGDPCAARWDIMADEWQRTSSSATASST
jgi:hypothetical protein